MQRGATFGIGCFQQICRATDEQGDNTDVSGETGKMQGGELAGVRLVTDLDPRLVQQSSHYMVTPGVGGKVDRGELALEGECRDQSIFGFCWQGRLRVCRDVLEQLPSEMSSYDEMIVMKN